MDHEEVNNRKMQHIDIALKQAEIDRNKSYFDSIRLTHRALPELNAGDIDPSITLFAKHLSFPLLISPMTGGDHDLLRIINKNMAVAAEKTGIAFAVGSQRVMFTNPKALESFELRRYAPDALIFANLGAVQLNYGFGRKHCQKAIDILGADGLFLHLNPLQEAVQPEGNIDFAGLSEKIKKVAKSIEKPIILKEVGCGLSAKDVELALNCGITTFDVAGSGGTSWSRIENDRRLQGEKYKLGITFQDWGIPTPYAIEALAGFMDRITVFASGGLRTGIDMVKAIVLGAKLCGIALPFLRPALESPEKVIEVIERLRREFTLTMFLLGVRDVASLHRNTGLIRKSSL
jgi:isopentenyl-diphosphate delta-isomerase